jgi:hypothetical protein
MTMKPIDVIITGVIISGIVSAFFLLNVWPFNLGR